GENRKLQIFWTPYGKVDSIIKYNAMGTMIQNIHTYLYDAMGNQVRDITFSSGSYDTTYHIYDGHNTLLAVYHNQPPAGSGSSRMTVTERYIYGSERIGTVKGTNVLGTYWHGGASYWIWGPSYEKEYELHDHLGNV